jgi:uncharacterized membrane protein
MRTRSLRSLVYFGGGLGLIVALFAAAEFFDASLTKVCSFGQKFSCGSVDMSGNTTTFGVQDWIWGIAGFVAILAIAVVAERWPKDSRVAYLLLVVTSAGVALAFYLLYVEVVEIGSICPVCVTAYAMGGVAWVGAMGLARKGYRRAHRARDDGTSPSQPDPS